MKLTSKFKKIMATVFATTLLFSGGAAFYLHNANEGALTESPSTDSSAKFFTSKTIDKIKFEPIVKIKSVKGAKIKKKETKALWYYKYSGKLPSGIKYSEVSVSRQVEGTLMIRLKCTDNKGNVFYLSRYEGQRENYISIEDRYSRLSNKDTLKAIRILNKFLASHK